MKIEDIIFVDRLPKIDLHGFDRETARVAVNDFVRDNKGLKNEFINIVHGIGSGILRTSVHEVLKRNRDVLEYKTYYYNQGCTIAKIRIDK